MKTLCVMAVWLSLAVLGVFAGGMASTHSLATGRVAVTNVQANSSWVVVAVAVAFDAVATGTVMVQRVSQGHAYTLATCVHAAVTNLVWCPDADFPFAYGDALVVDSTATNGVVQVMRKGE
jgi:hypothetical protein